MLTAEQMPKIRPVPLGRSKGPRVYELLEDWRYDDHPLGPIILRCPFFSDLASIPPYVPRFVLSPDGYLFIPGFVHDYIYKHRFIWTEQIDPKYLEVADPPLVEPRVIKYWAGRERADEIFREIADIVSPDHTAMTKVATAALAVGGWKAWNDHRARDEKVIDIKGVS